MALMCIVVLWCLLLCKNGMCIWELAKEQEAEASSTHFPYWNASNAVDGNENPNVYCNSCLHTTQDNPAYLIVNLKTAYSIKRIEIFFVEYAYSCDDQRLSAKENVQKRSKGYSVQITRNKTIDGRVCFKDNTTDFRSFQLNQSQPCEGTGQYVSIVQRSISGENGVSGALLMICEFKVYGCPLGLYGVNCTKSCVINNCSSCDPGNGTCWTCRDGVYGPNCTTECLDGKYGRNCSYDCGQCRNGNICNKENGTCPNFECAAGYKENVCMTECSESEFGENCIESCGHCREGSCDKRLGNCSNNECAQGYDGFLCKTACKDGFYGHNCNTSCGACEMSCDKRYGNCSGNVCSDGYHGVKCNTKCPAGTYGKNCSQVCGSCLNGRVCNHEVGVCPGSLCESGYRGDLCKMECPDGTYGYNCSQSCGFCLNQEHCDKSYGFCKIPLCDSGYQRLLCKDTCDEGTYGYNCSEQCGFCKGSVPCKAQDGSCPNSQCKEGYKGENCKRARTLNISTARTLIIKVLGMNYDNCPCTYSECGIAEYGENCESVCGACRDYICHPVNGTCLNGCRFGKTPPLCTESLHQTETMDTLPAVAGGIVGSLVIVLLFVAVILIFIRRQNLCAMTNSAKEGTAQVYEANLTPSDSNTDYYETLGDATATSGESSLSAEHCELEKTQK